MEYTSLGHTTNMAARLCSAAAPGEILTVESMHKAASEQRKLYQAGLPLPHMGFCSRGRMSFKNVAEPVEVIAVTRKD